MNTIQWLARPMGDELPYNPAFYESRVKAAISRIICNAEKIKANKWGLKANGFGASLIIVDDKYKVAKDFATRNGIHVGDSMVCGFSKLYNTKQILDYTFGWTGANKPFLDAWLQGSEYIRFTKSANVLLYGVTRKILNHYRGCGYEHRLDQKWSDIVDATLNTINTRRRQTHA